MRLLTEYRAVSALPAVDWREGLPAARLVTVWGRFAPSKYWLLDNQIKRGRVGFDVIMPFVVGEQVLLVNRGWVAGDPGRRSLPEVDTPAGHISITGRVYYPHRADGPSLAADWYWPRIIGHLGLVDMARDIELIQVPRAILRLQQDSPGALLTGWPTVNVSPQKHRAYAMQWFAMALALFLLTAVYSSNLVQWWRQAK
ncbi:MAG: SURF1 family protein, partial [Cellvibrionaceae bacterium]|nr:SURF1 family protein [Cellvibrionaceae bacterium]